MYCRNAPITTARRQPRKLGCGAFVVVVALIALAGCGGGGGGGGGAGIATAIGARADAVVQSIGNTAASPGTRSVTQPLGDGSGIGVGEVAIGTASAKPTAFFSTSLNADVYGSSDTGASGSGTALLASLSPQYDSANTATSADQGNILRSDGKTDAGGQQLKVVNLSDQTQIANLLFVGGAYSQSAGQGTGEGAGQDASQSAGQGVGQNQPQSTPGRAILATGATLKFNPEVGQYTYTGALAWTLRNDFSNIVLGTVNITLGLSSGESTLRIEGQSRDDPATTETNEQARLVFNQSDGLDIDKDLGRFRILPAKAGAASARYGFTAGGAQAAAMPFALQGLLSATYDKAIAAVFSTTGDSAREYAGGFVGSPAAGLSRVYSIEGPDSDFGDARDIPAPPDNAAGIGVSGFGLLFDVGTPGVDVGTLSASRPAGHTAHFIVEDFARYAGEANVAGSAARRRALLMQYRPLWDASGSGTSNQDPTPDPRRAQDESDAPSPALPEQPEYRAHLTRTVSLTYSDTPATARSYEYRFGDSTVAAFVFSGATSSESSRGVPSHIIADGLARTGTLSGEYQWEGIQTWSAWRAGSLGAPPAAQPRGTFMILYDFTPAPFSIPGFGPLRKYFTTGSRTNGVLDGDIHIDPTTGIITGTGAGMSFIPPAQGAEQGGRSMPVRLYGRVYGPTGVAVAGVFTTESGGDTGYAGAFLGGHPVWLVVDPDIELAPEGERRAGLAHGHLEMGDQQSIGVNPLTPAWILSLDLDRHIFERDNHSVETGTRALLSNLAPTFSGTPTSLGDGAATQKFGSISHGGASLVATQIQARSGTGASAAKATLIVIADRPDQDDGSGGDTGDGGTDETGTQNVDPGNTASQDIDRTSDSLIVAGGSAFSITPDSDSTSHTVGGTARLRGSFTFAGGQIIARRSNLAITLPGDFTMEMDFDEGTFTYDGIVRRGTTTWNLNASGANGSIDLDSGTFMASSIVPGDGSGNSTAFASIHESTSEQSTSTSRKPATIKGRFHGSNAVAVSGVFAIPGTGAADSIDETQLGGFAGRVRPLLLDSDAKHIITDNDSEQINERAFGYVPGEWTGTPTTNPHKPLDVHFISRDVTTQISTANRGDLTWLVSALEATPVADDESPRHDVNTPGLIETGLVAYQVPAATTDAAAVATLYFLDNGDDDRIVVAGASATPSVIPAGEHTYKGRISLAKPFGESAAPDHADGMAQVEITVQLPAETDADANADPNGTFTLKAERLATSIKPGHWIRVTGGTVDANTGILSVPEGGLVYKQIPKLTPQGGTTQTPGADALRATRMRGQLFGAAGEAVGGVYWGVATTGNALDLTGGSGGGFIAKKQ